MSDKISKIQIANPVIDLVLGNIDSLEFTKRFAMLSYNIHKTGEPNAISEADEIESYMAPYLVGVCSLDWFLGAMRIRYNFDEDGGYKLAYVTEVYP